MHSQFRGMGTLCMSGRKHVSGLRRTDFAVSRNLIICLRCGCYICGSDISGKLNSQWFAEIGVGSFQSYWIKRVNRLSNIYANCILWTMAYMYVAWTFVDDHWYVSNLRRYDYLLVGTHLEWFTYRLQYLCFQIT